MSRLRRFLNQPRQRRSLLLPCAAALLRAHWRVRMWPFARLAPTLGVLQTSGVAAAAPAAAADEAVAADLRWVMATLERLWPRRPTCLMLAVAAREVLVERGLACELYFGVRGRAGDAKPRPPSIEAHAWLRCAGLVVTGEREAERFEPIAIYRCGPAIAPPPR